MISRHTYGKYCLLIFALINPSALCDQSEDSIPSQSKSYERAKLGLVRGEDQVIIHMGDWLVLEEKSTRKVLAKGNYIKFSTDDSSMVTSLRLRNKTYQNINVEDIGKIWIGPARETWKYVKRASLYGVVVGIGAGIAMVAPEQDWIYMGLTIPFSIAFTVPVMGLGGAWYGKFLEYNRANAYLLIEENSGAVQNSWDQLDKRWELKILNP